MITHILEPMVCERFSNEERYREGHLRVINALPNRKVLGLHIPEIKRLAKQIATQGCVVRMPNGTEKRCTDGRGVIQAFEIVSNSCLCYEETLIWGFLINLQKCTLQERLLYLERYVPVLDNWAVCDTYCANAKWMQRADKDVLWLFLQRWFNSQREFEVRFAVIVAMTYFLDEEYLDKVFECLNNIHFNSIKSAYTTEKGKPKQVQQGTVQGVEPYYVRMGVAWLLATALAKFPNQTRAFVRGATLPADVIKLYIRKARESFRTKEVNAL